MYLKSILDIKNNIRILYIILIKNGNLICHSLIIDNNALCFKCLRALQVFLNVWV